MNIHHMFWGSHFGKGPHEGYLSLCEQAVGVNDTKSNHRWTVSSLDNRALTVLLLCPSRLSVSGTSGPAQRKGRLWMPRPSSPATQQWWKMFPGICSTSRCLVRWPTTRNSWCEWQMWGFIELRSLHFILKFLSKINDVLLNSPPDGTPGPTTLFPP